MPSITTNARREIIEDFARAIREKKTLGAKPAITVINFRNEKQDGIERPVERVPLDLSNMKDEHAQFSGSIPAAYHRYLGPMLFQPYAEDLTARSLRH